MSEFGSHLASWGLEPSGPTLPYADLQPSQPEGHYIDEAGTVIPVGIVDFSGFSAQELTDAIIPELYAESENEQRDEGSRQIAREMYLAACRQQVALLQEGPHTPDWLTKTV